MAFSKEFTKAAHSILKAGTADGACLTRIDFATQLKGHVGRKVDMGTLERWAGDSIKLGLFNTDSEAYRLKRGVKGGIESYRPKGRKAAPKAAAPKKATTAPVVSQSETPAAQPVAQA